MELEYTPKACQGDDATLSGSVTIKLPSVIQKYDYIDKCGLNVSAEGEVNMASLNTIRFIKTLIELSEDHYVKIDLKKKSNGASVTTWDDLIHDPECAPVANEVATALIGGFRPSGN